MATEVNPGGGDSFTAVGLKTVAAGESQPGNLTGADHQRTVGEWALSAPIDLSVDAGSVVWPGPCLFGGWWLATAIAVTAITIDDGTTVKLTLATTTALGEKILLPTIINNYLKVSPASGSTGSIQIWYRPLDPSVIWNI